ncbi:hemerythrin domain-containing protein [Kordia zhangzhouensis]|uniref:hemerythrin domain-containing protein n=1 Tax=Kordia zhangzhouensis TaxID=1620405 RepID=UPI000629B21E|nr:hemerythrin domain-containing protein [Kordia zhangzhouensis]
MKIFEAIRKDHDIQRKLLDELIKTSGDTERRTHVFEALKHELKIHEDAEERHFYKPLISDDMMQNHARHGIAEHHEIDELVEKLEDTEQDSSAWLKYAKDLQHKVLHHLDDEEHTFFQLAGKVLSEKEKEGLATKYVDFMDEARNNVAH